MKELKIIAIATIVTVCLIVSCAFATASAEADDLLDRGEFYPKLTIVVSSTLIEDQLWVVECIDKAGNLWSFYDDEGEWERGDLANLLMWKHTPDPLQDEVVEIYWEGYTEDMDSFRAEMGWI